jgi:hypothetical protein
MEFLTDGMAQLFDLTDERKRRERARRRKNLEGFSGLDGDWFEENRRQNVRRERINGLLAAFNALPEMPVVLP